MATIKGTTEFVKNSTINLDDKVIITDNLYKIADIELLSPKSTLKIKLEKTSSVTVFEDTAAKLITVLGSVESYTGPVRATTVVDAAEINTLAGLTTGVVTGTIPPVPVDSALVASLTNVKTTDKISFASTAATAKATDIVALKAKLPLANFSAIAKIEGTSDDIAALKSAANIVKTAPIEVTAGVISAANANALAKSTSGIVTAEVTADTAAALNKALVDAKGDALTLTVSGKTATAADLKALAGKTSVAVEASSIETITGNAADVKAVLKAVTDSEITLGTPDITVSGTISAGDANTIASHASATGVVTAKVEAGTANSLNLALGVLGGADKLSLTVLNNSDGSATSAAHLVALDTKTASKIKVDAKALTGTEGDLTTIFVDNKDNFIGLGNKAVNIETPNAAADKVNAILKATSGVVTATVAAGDAAALREALVDAKATDKLTLTVTSPVKAADLKALDAKTSEVVNAKANAIEVNGNAADIKAVIKSAGVDLAANAVINVTGKISAADVNTISKATTGEVTAAEVTAGTVAALNKALADILTPDKDALTLTVTGATAAVSDLIDLNKKTSEVVNATAVNTVTGSLADLGTFDTAAADFTLNPTLNATVSGVVEIGDATDLQSLLTSTNITGKVTATVVSSTAVALVAALNDKGASTDALTLNVVENKDLATGVVTKTDAADLVTLDEQTSVKVKVDATQIEGTYDNLESVYVTGKAGFSNLGNETVTIAGSNSATKVDSILKATTGVVTATVTDASASDLVANLKNAKNNDALTLTVNGASEKASDLNTLDGKTSKAVVIHALTTSITGNIADVTKVFVTNKGNFTGEETKAVTISGTVTAAQADAIADATSGAVTANIAAGTAAALNTALVDFGGQVNAYTLTVNGTTANASDLNALDGKTSVTVNAAAIKNIEGTATAVKAAYDANALKTISGLGNETVDLSKATDANVSLVKAINDFTTGVINVSSVTTAVGAGATTFKLKDLGDLDGITGLYNLNTVDTATTVITLSIADLLAANDSKKSFDFTVKGDALDTVNITDVSGWTPKEVVDATQYTFTKGTQTITVNFEGFTTGDVVLPA